MCSLCQSNQLSIHFHLRFFHNSRPLCARVAQAIALSAALLHDNIIRFNTNSFWRRRYCPKHRDDSTLQCCSCTSAQHLMKIATRLIAPLCRTTLSASTPIHSGRSGTVPSTGMTALYNAETAQFFRVTSFSVSLNWTTALCACTA